MQFACSLCIGDVQKGRVLSSSSEWALVNLPKLPPILDAGVFNICKNVISRKILTFGYSRNGICHLMLDEHSKKTVDTNMRALARKSQHQKCYRQKLFWCYSSYPSPNQRLCILLCFHHPILAILICPIVTIHPPPHPFLLVCELPFCSPAT